MLIWLFVLMNYVEAAGICASAAWQATADTTPDQSKQCLCSLANITRTTGYTLVLNNYDLSLGGNKSFSMGWPTTTKWNTDCEVEYRVKLWSGVTTFTPQTLLTGPARYHSSLLYGDGSLIPASALRNLASFHEQSTKNEQFIYVEYYPITALKSGYFQN